MRWNNNRAHLSGYRSVQYSIDKYMNLLSTHAIYSSHQEMSLSFTSPIYLTVTELMKLILELHQNNSDGLIFFHITLA